MARRTRTRQTASPAPRTGNPPELVVVTRRQAAFRASAGRFVSEAGEKVTDLEKLLARHGATIAPLFGATEERVLASLTRHAEFAQAPMEDLSVYYRVDAPVERLTELRERLAASELVEAAYIKPAVELPAINEMTPSPEEPPPATPDFSARQIYLDAPPAGIDARWAWTQAGGRGRDIRIIDIEGAWRFTHEDLTQNQGGVVAGTQISGVDWRNHGTAVLGEYSGDLNSIGVLGIASDAVASAVSHGSIGSAAAINQAAGRLRAGDVMLLEMHRPGPRFNFASRSDQRGYIAVEWWPDDYAAIRNATSRGIIVVEAAGNGAENLDDALYQTPAAGFPAGWSNSFRRSNRDSGAIVVGAGAPPPGTHGRNHGPDRSRLDFSNWGALIDAQGWGREVTTCGYGDLQGGSNEDLWYTDTFSGTSSASPIVTGAIAAIQGMAKARGRPVLTPAQVRNCLRSTGSPQQDAPGRPVSQRIGNRPDIRALAACAFGKGKEISKEVVKETKESFKDNKDSKDRKDIIKEKEAAKDNKDRKDVAKEGKEGKEGFKDLKDAIKETKEGKELKEKEFKEGKEIKEFKEGKEKDKDIFEGKPLEVRPGGAEAGGGQTEDRLAALEQAVQQLVHFIGQELRPDLSRSALQGQVAASGQAAKDEKDLKDSEKPSES
ncbi:MAG TPA: S8 family peptidase [Bauldia sp.]|nr:S8 family peptidase [Bauldia sp.]